MICLHVWVYLETVKEAYIALESSLTDTIADRREV